MHPPGTVAEVLELHASGLGARRIAGRTDLPVATVRDWLAGRVPRHSREELARKGLTGRCDRCGGADHRYAQLPAGYVYLLGLYLGDGCISEYARQVYRLRIFLDLRYPLIIDECEGAIRELMPDNRIQRRERGSNFVDRLDASNVEISAYSKAWPCLFPQHGPGKKHERRIELVEWQREIVDRVPEPLIRGLIHSDGCRATNAGRGGWSHPRYSFSNRSDDIHRILRGALDRIGVRWTAAPRTTYVSRVADVAHLDGFVGAKA